MPIRVIGYFPTVRVTNDETVRIRKVGYQGPAGRPASDFNFSELANVADSAAPTLGNIPCGDGTLWQSVALTPALAGADPAGSAATAQAVAIAAAATRSDNASNLSTGTVPLARLAGITNAQLSATAGILSSQIAGLDASKITGTFPLSLLNQGTTGQFLRGDGTYSNTLTGGLTIAGALAGATTGSFSTSVTTPLLAPAVASAGINVSDNLNFTTSQAIDGTKFAFGRTTGGNMFLNITAGLNFGIYVAGVAKANIGETSTLSGTGGLTFGGGSSTALSTAQVAIGSRIGGRLNLGAGTSVVQEIGGTAVTTVSGTGLAVTGAMAATGAVSGTTGAFSGAVTLSSACKIIYGSAGTTNSANNEIVGTSTGNKHNVASGLYHELLVAGTKNSQFGRAGLAASAGSLSLGAWGLGASYDQTKPGIEINSSTAAINIHGGGQIQMFVGTGVSIFRMGYSPLDGGVSSNYAWGIGAYAAGLTSAYSGVGSSGDGSMTMGVASSGSIKMHVNTLFRRSQTHIGGVIIADLGAPVVLARSTTTTLMTATSRYGWLRIVDNTGQYAVIRIANAATPVIESSSANFAITASPTDSQLGINLSEGTLSIITGSAVGTTISASFQGK